MTEKLVGEIQKLWEAIGRLQTQDRPTWVFLSAPLTSASWDGDSYSTTAKTLIDLSAVFSAPAGIKAILVWIQLNDSGSSGGAYRFVLSPNDTANSGMLTRIPIQTNDTPYNASFIVPCDANGDVYYQVTASGVGTMDIYVQIWGYLI